MGLYFFRSPTGKNSEASGVGYEEIYCRFISPRYNPDRIDAVAGTDTATSRGTGT